MLTWVAQVEMRRDEALLPNVPEQRKQVRRLPTTITMVLQIRDSCTQETKRSEALKASKTSTESETNRDIWPSRGNTTSLASAERPSPTEA